MKRLHHSEDIQTLWQSVRPVRAEGFLVRIAPSQEEHHRVGVIVPKKYVSLAVKRNTIKRRMREAIREWLVSNGRYHQSQKYDILVLLSRREEPRTKAEYMALIALSEDVFLL